MADNLAMALYRIGELEKIAKDLAAEVASIERRNQERDVTRAALERSQLKWGIMFFGGVIMSLGTVIWNYRNVIFRGGQ